MSWTCRADGSGHDLYAPPFVAVVIMAQACKLSSSQSALTPSTQSAARSRSGSVTIEAETNERGERLRVRLKEVLGQQARRDGGRP